MVNFFYQSLLYSTSPNLVDDISLTDTYFHFLKYCYLFPISVFLQPLLLFLIFFFLTLKHSHSNQKELRSLKYFGISLFVKLFDNLIIATKAFVSWCDDINIFKKWSTFEMHGIFTIKSLLQVESRIWACAESNIRVCWINLWSSDNH